MRINDLSAVLDAMDEARSMRDELSAQVKASRRGFGAQKDRMQFSSAGKKLARRADIFHSPQKDLEQAVLMRGYGIFSSGEELKQSLLDEIEKRQGKTEGKRSDPQSISKEPEKLEASLQQSFGRLLEKYRST